MTQQTIGNTVYTVGQEVSINDIWTLPVGVVLQRIASPGISPYFAATKQLRITALPNPDPVADDNVIPPDEVVAYARHVQHVWFISPADNILSYIKGPINTNEMMKLEWLIAKGVTFYKQKPEGV